MELVGFNKPVTMLCSLMFGAFILYRYQQDLEVEVVLWRNSDQLNFL
jgi:hypothetical protein